MKSLAGSCTNVLMLFLTAYLALSLEYSGRLSLIEYLMYLTALMNADAIPVSQV